MAQAATAQCSYQPNIQQATLLVRPLRSQEQVGVKGVTTTMAREGGGGRKKNKKERQKERSRRKGAKPQTNDISNSVALTL